MTQTLKQRDAIHRALHAEKSKRLQFRLTLRERVARLFRTIFRRFV